MYTHILIFIIGIVLIIKSADLFTAGAEGIAVAFRIPQIVIGATIVSLATTAPEFTVSSISSYMGIGGMAIGNALGSCLANIGLVLAIAVIIKPIKFRPKILREELLLLIIVSFILYLFMLDNRIGLIEGVFLLFLLAGFFTYIVLRELRGRNRTEDMRSSGYSIKKDCLKFFIGAVGVIVSAKYAIVPSGINIAHLLGVPEVVIGLTIIAVGTSLPELFTAVVASMKNKGDLAVGNVIGANILNILWVMGASASIRPLTVDIETKKITMPVVLFITLLMFLFSWTKLKLTRNEGLWLFIIYAGYMFYIFKFAY